MTQAYSDCSRESDPHALPDVEVFYLFDGIEDDDGGSTGPGWFYWFCFPGCLPDSDPVGPFASEQEATNDAQATGIDLIAESLRA